MKWNTFCFLPTAFCFLPEAGTKFCLESEHKMG